jgi:hypothetical protein
MLRLPSVSVQLREDKMIRSSEGRADSMALALATSARMISRIFAKVLI